MIAVDTSAIMAIVLNGPEADACIAVLEAEDDILISAGTVTEVQRQFKYPDSFRRDGLTGSALFSMTLARNGDIVQVELLKSSRNADIDAYVENVICLSRPLPAIPRSMPSPTLALRVLVRVGPETERR